MYDTYISPQEYTGPSFHFMRETMRMARWNGGKRYSLQNLFQSNLMYTSNRAANNSIVGGTINWNYGIHYHIPLSDNLKLLLGGVGDTNAGFVYNLRNSNNPASVRAYINIDASAMLIWNFRIRRHLFTLRYQANVPVGGIMFSPNYGQSYYEIFTLGDWKGVFKLTSLHNQPAIRQLLTLDVPIKRNKLRISYLYDIQQSRINNLRTHIYGHILMIGVVKTLYWL
jgi:hypothetical protein